MLWLTPGVARLVLLLACVASAVGLCFAGKITGPMVMTAVVGPIIGWAIANASARQASDAKAANGSGEQPPAPPAGT